LQEHIVVTLFLTMLVGAGGNAGNQSAIKVIRGLVSAGQQPELQQSKHCMSAIV
jgi:Mg/Co/Ni transporter MgtE